MASATGIPQEHPRTIEAEAEQPLLGGPGAATQREEGAMPCNVFTGEINCPIQDRYVFCPDLIGIGTATIAQAGIWVVSAAPHADPTGL